jgi:hypothetical protein
VTPAGEKLDRMLSEAIAQFGGAKPREVAKMPEIGGKSLAAQVRLGLVDLKKQIDDLKLDSAAALTELATEIANGKEGVKRIRAETAEVKSAFAEILGNEQANTSEQK